MEEFEAQGWKRPEVGQKLGKNFVIRKSKSNPMTIISTNYIIYGQAGEASLYLAELAVPGSATSSELTGVELLNSQKLIYIGDYCQIEFELLIDFGEITYVAMDESSNLLLYKVDVETPGDGTEEPTIPDDGTETPDDAITDKFSNWLNDTFGFKTTGSVVGSIALLVAGAFLLNAVLGKK